ncbi:MAG TPA: glycosyltransferase family 4 protein [Candidatus Acidoferrales bacterium]|nr:glycosyltransferase family 4 protein [Candidatus Acidoferrales bacterium]
MKKIAFIASNEYVSWGGSEYLWGAAAEQLVQRGMEVSVSKGWSCPVEQIEHLRAAGCRVFYRTVNPSFLRRAVRKLPPWRNYVQKHTAKLVSRADLAVVSQGGNIDGLIWMEALQSIGCRYVAIVEGGADVWWANDDLIERLAKAYAGAHAVYFVAEATVDLCRRQFVIPLTQAKVIRNPFNVRYDARPPWPSPGEGLSLGFVSRLEIGGKGHDLLLQVLGLPHWRGRDVSVSLYGDGPNERSLRRMVDAARLTSVQFGGLVANLEKIWANHHALILPSRYEGMPLVLVEAMLCGRPAIITDVGGVRELVRDNVNGFLAKAPTVELLDEAMNRAWENRHRLKEMGEQAAIDVRKFVSPDPVEDFVRELLALVDSPCPAEHPAQQHTMEART